MICLFYFAKYNLQCIGLCMLNFDCQDLQKKYKNVEVIFNNENLGIGAAQNIGIKKAMKENFNWVLLLDHDSKLSSNMVGKLLTAYDVLFKQGINKVGIVAANPYDINSNEWIYIKMKYLKLEKDLIKFDNVISSGSLINLEVFKDVGLFNESLFMYYIDKDFCLRCKNKGWKTYVCSSAVLYHQEGNRKTKKIFGITIYCHNYGYDARYYISRNTVYIIMNYCFSNPTTCIKTFLRLVMDVFKIGLFEQDRLNKLNAVLKGLCDGLRGKRGSM